MPDFANIARWTHASIADYFKSNLGDSLPLIIEEQDRKEGMTEFAELSVNGPYINNPSRNVYFIDFDISILINVCQTDSDLYRTQRVIGLVLPLFDLDIPIYKYGDDPEIDDQSLYNCLTVRQDRGDDVVVVEFGIIVPESRMTQTVIGAIWKMMNTD